MDFGGHFNIEEHLVKRAKGPGRPGDLALFQDGPVPYFYFPALEAAGGVVHGFSTRLGGVSRGDFASLNFSRTRGDDPAAVDENYRRMAAALGVDVKSMVLSHQTHTVNVRLVTEADAGKGVVRERDYENVDGLITDVPGITLVTFYADCVPLYFYDPVKRAVGLSHSGWRGTVRRMGQVTMAAMAEAFGSRPEDTIACIGPSICRGCYEVGPEVAEEFEEAFDRSRWEDILDRKENGKYQLDLWRANAIILEEAGIPKNHIHVTDVCTCCNPEYLYSHRRMGERRGNLCAFLGLSDEKLHICK